MAALRPAHSGPEPAAPASFSEKQQPWPQATAVTFSGARRRERIKFICGFNPEGAN